MRKGFTLIELLAVIVILAIIATIATPIVLNIIEDAKNKSIVISAVNFVDGISTEIMRANLTADINPISCNITNGDNASCYDKNGRNVPIEINMDGTKFNGGHIVYDDGKVVSYTLCLDNTSITEQGEKVDNSTYCTNLNDPNASKYNVKFYVNNEEYKTGSNYDSVNNQYKTFVEGSSELIMPEIPLNHDILSLYNVPVAYKWVDTETLNKYNEGTSYTINNSDRKFFSQIVYNYTEGTPWIYYWNVSNGGKYWLNGSLLYGGIKNSFHLAPLIDDYAYKVVPFKDGTTYTFDELNTTYASTKFAAISLFFALNTDNVVGTGVKAYVGDYLEPDVVLSDDFYLIDPNSNSDFIDTKIIKGTGALADPVSIATGFSGDPYVNTYNAVRVLRLIVPEEYKNDIINVAVKYRDTSLNDYVWLYYKYNVSKYVK